jgi:ATP-dependent 26S proteasome regulatory subunit
VGDPHTSGFELLGERLRVAVAADIAAGRDPDDPDSGVYISPESAWEDALGVELSAFTPELELAAARLGLDPIATNIVAACAAVEVDPRLGRAFGFLHDDATCRFATPRLLVRLLGDGVLERVAADAPLRGLGCLVPVPTGHAVALLDEPLQLAPPLTSFLLGATLDVRDPELRRQNVPPYPLGRDAFVERIRTALALRQPPPVLVAGPDALPVIAVALQRDLILVAAGSDREQIARARLTAALSGAACVLDRVEAVEPDALAAVAGGALLAAGSPAALARLGALDAVVVELPLPSQEERRAAWSALAEAVDTVEVAAKFRLSCAQIARAVEIAKMEARTRGGRKLDAADLEDGARRASSSGLGQRAHRVTHLAAWSELVLPGRQQAQLRSISAYLRHRDQVLYEWGFERTVGARQGLKVLFAGESGTGKTMAAGVLAADLGLELFAIDLTTVVSKYVGETEQNLERIFAAAEGSNAILLFDEADALFGKRSEVSDAKDRYANIEVAYLLQRMDAHPGAAILATNLKQNVDDAFLRRLDFVIDFPLPDVADRKLIWRRVLPAAAPLAPDVRLGFLAERFKLSGGSIRNCAVAAAFEAAAAGKPIGMAQLVRAVATEYGKLGRLAVESDFGGYLVMLRDADADADADSAQEPAPELSTPPAGPPPRVRSRIQEL